MSRLLLQVDEVAVSLGAVQSSHGKRYNSGGYCRLRTLVCLDFCILDSTAPDHARRFDLLPRFPGEQWGICQRWWALDGL